MNDDLDLALPIPPDDDDDDITDTASSPIPNPSNSPNSPNNEQDIITTKWNEFVTHLNTWFYDVDIEAVAIVLSTTISHFNKDSLAAWLFVIGPSGGDKT